ncbi:PLP-dependent aminotransferase family protein [Lysinibacter sp. HNR]|uniref:aminotransferase-like domain-containing protein n=1 Tax=Lysinibacter sp. HNR TaxID=3031408 RepID=UPI002435EAAE|nr:PLP-dependent aminotransferase family protein [Lysinibacter sp. HNR]WGD37337.1 PLP-dependent aminotransferase family protein [Lysinibacter sp. HNR]
MTVNLDTISPLKTWDQHYSDRALALSSSEVRALFAVSSRPEIVSLAGGMPLVSGPSFDQLDESLRRVLAFHGSRALQYGSGQGAFGLREHISALMESQGVQASPDDVVVTTGSQQALELLTKIFVNPGDIVLTEAPTYVGAIGVFRSYQAEIAQVPIDHSGLIPEMLEEHIQRLRAAGKTVKFLYTIPNFHNPSGITLSNERRIQIIEICKRNNVLIVEDDPYGMLFFTEATPPAMRSMSNEVVYLGSFSKTLAPGLRVGWTLAPREIREKLILAVESAILCTSSFNQYVVSDYLTNVNWENHLGLLRYTYHGRKKAMVRALKESLGDLSWTDPGGGFFVWLSLPEELDSQKMLPQAIQELVAYTPGTAFYANGDGRKNIRLSFCYPTEKEINIGIKRLAAVINVERNTLHNNAREIRGSLIRHL